MPKYKAKILNQEIDIQYENNDKQKLLSLIENLNSRLIKYNKLIGKVSENKIIILTALEIEDELKEKKKIISQKKSNQIKIDDKESTIEKLSSEIISLKDKIRNIELEQEQKKNDDLLIEKEIDAINILIKKLNQNMLSYYDE